MSDRSPTVIDRARSLIRSVAAALAVLTLVGTFLFVELLAAPLIVIAGTALVGIVLLVIAAGPSAVADVFVPDRIDRSTTQAAHNDHPEWWLAKLEPALDEVWDRRADYVLAGGLALGGVLALGALVRWPGNDPPLGLPIVGFLCLNAALIVLAMSMVDAEDERR